MLNKTQFSCLLASLFLLLGCQTTAPSKIQSSSASESQQDDGDFEMGAKAASTGDYATAFRYWEAIAKNGHTKAQHNMGVLYDEGLGFPQDYTEAMRWYQLAAQKRLHAIAK